MKPGQGRSHHTGLYYFRNQKNKILSVYECFVCRCGLLCIFGSTQRGQQRVASCRGTGDRLEATSHPRVTPNSLDLPSSSPAFVQAYQYLLQQRWRRLCFHRPRFVSLLPASFYKFGRNLPYWTIMISLYIKTEKRPLRHGFDTDMWHHA